MTRNRYMVGLVLLTFFVISLLTNILGPIVPDIISNFHVSLTAAGFWSSLSSLRMVSCQFRRGF
jgi:MFS transporter, FHS family, L-fucose permease